MSETAVVEVSHTNLKQLLAQVGKMGEIILVRDGQPLARILPYHGAKIDENDIPFPALVPQPGDMMTYEIEAYSSQQAQLIENYLDQYVAMYQGQVVDHDRDRSALLERINHNYPQEIVLIRRVGPELPQPLKVRSPRLLKIT